MTDKHTPGPWSLDLGNIGIDIENHVSVDAPSHGGIANVVWVMEEDALMGKNSPKCEANARLIAAAPDLLQAAKDVLSHKRGEGDWLILSVHCQALEEVIAKASGSTS